MIQFLTHFRSFSLTRGLTGVILILVMCIVCDVVKQSFLIRFHDVICCCCWSSHSPFLTIARCRWGAFADTRRSACAGCRSKTKWWRCWIRLKLAAELNNVKGREDQITESMNIITGLRFTCVTRDIIGSNVLTSSSSELSLSIVPTLTSSAWCRHNFRRFSVCSSPPSAPFACDDDDESNSDTVWSSPSASTVLSVFKESLRKFIVFASLDGSTWLTVGLSARWTYEIAAICCDSFAFFAIEQKLLFHFTKTLGLLLL